MRLSDEGDRFCVETGLLVLLNGYQPGQLAPMQHAERDLARLRQRSTLHHLAHGLVGHAQYLIRLGDIEAAETAIGEASGIAARLRCQPLLDRAADLPCAEPRIRAPTVTASGPEVSAAVRAG